MVSKPPSRGYAEAWLLESTTDITKKYTVSKRPDGTFACSCPAWKFATSPKPDCKHIDAIRQAITALRPEVINSRAIGLPRPRMVEVSFDNRVICCITEEQADAFKANLLTLKRERQTQAPPPQPAPTYGDFTIRRKFKLGGE